MFGLAAQTFFSLSFMIWNFKQEPQQVLTEDAHEWLELPFCIVGDPLPEQRHGWRHDGACAEALWRAMVAPCLLNATDITSIVFSGSCSRLSNSHPHGLLDDGPKYFNMEWVQLHVASDDVGSSFVVHLGCPQSHVCHAPRK